MAKSAAATPSGSGGSGGPGSPSPAQVAQQARARTPIEVTGAQSLVLSLEAMDVDTVFGLPGGAILPAGVRAGV